MSIHMFAINKGIQYLVKKYNKKGDNVPMQDHTRTHPLENMIPN